jgi:FtsP/CotA-like multicopper oxidase with cupredoxin domain
MAAYKTILSLVCTVILTFLSLNSVHAKTVEYELTIAQKEVNITGKTVQGMTINGGIPGPTLHFKRGISPAFTSITE